MSECKRGCVTCFSSNPSGNRIFLKTVVYVNVFQRTAARCTQPAFMYMRSRIVETLVASVYDGSKIETNPNLFVNQETTKIKEYISRRRYVRKLTKKLCNN